VLEKKYIYVSMVCKKGRRGLATSATSS